MAAEQQTASDKLSSITSAWTVWLPLCRFDTREVVVLMQQVAGALAHMHSKKLVHQDLHVGNLLLSLDGSAFKIADLGSARYCEIDDEPNWLSFSL